VKLVVPLALLDLCFHVWVLGTVHIADLADLADLADMVVVQVEKLAALEIEVGTIGRVTVV
jgi:hypothetical protein